MALDTYYEVEVMLGECDADHGFWALDYRAREQLKVPNARHVAVIVAEDLSGRYRALLQTLAERLPLIAVEMRTLLVESTPPVATTFPVMVAQPEDFVLRPADEPDGVDAGTPNDESSWQGSKPEFAQFARDMHKRGNEKIGPSTIDFSAKSYVALKKGRRVAADVARQGWCVRLHTRGDGGSSGQPTDFYATVKEALAPLGVEPSWTFHYNAGANPIAFPITSQNASHSKILEILTEAYSLA